MPAEFPQVIIEPSLPERCELAWPVGTELDPHAIPAEPNLALWIGSLRLETVRVLWSKDVHWGFEIPHKSFRVFPVLGQRLSEHYFVVRKHQPQLLAEYLQNPFLTLTHSRLSGTITSAAQFADVISRINSLSFAPEGDELGLIRPTYHAARNCIRILSDLVRLGRAVSLPSDIGVDRNADIRVTWGNAGRSIDLVSPSDENELPYVYYSSKEQYGIDENMTVEKFVEWLKWVQAAD